MQQYNSCCDYDIAVFSWVREKMVWGPICGETTRGIIYNIFECIRLHIWNWDRQTKNLFYGTDSLKTCLLLF